MRILLTGAAGFIGSHLAEALLRRGRGELVGLDNLSRGRMENLKNCRESIRFVKGDVRDRELLVRMTEDCDVVFHLAAQSSVMDAVADPDVAFSCNVVGTYNVLAAAQAARVSRVIFTSSREVYGDPAELPVRETAPLAPKNMYGASKVAGEMYCRAFAEAGLNTKILRFGNAYGPRDRDRVIPLFIEHALGAQPLTLFGGEQILDFVWIDLVVDALVKAGLDDPTSETLNIASGVGTSIRVLAKRVLQATGSASELRVFPSRSPEVSRFVADTGRAQRILGFTPPHDPLYRLGDAVQWMRTVTGNPEGAACVADSKVQ
jgi:UDP-glucose 4-epimerase